ncbi:PIN domain nuclease [Streptomyces sp. SP18ES09]|uniref:PIN domain nuclease n=1 Tax=Streptomyces sp. SP18ES09 TaxID=3002532 RepID=UPI002E7A70BE|nr:PIN domain nuclease [Streptomyces sp. SP18ES09]MEE1814081.1 PIN domain nuclease [Streptomyces sp. SP18ES09]
MITYLIDTSAYVHLGTDPAAQRRWDAEIETGAIGICEATRTEILFSATGAADRDDIDEDLAALFATVRVPKDAWRWVDTAQYKLTQKGQHRAAGVVDLLLCATAVHHGLILLHRDNDFATVARVLKEVQQQDVRRLDR